MAQVYFKIAYTDKVRFDAGDVCLAYPTETHGINYIMLSEESNKVVIEPFRRGGYTVRLKTD